METHCRRGEIDLEATDGNLIFVASVEVEARRNLRLYLVIW
jgi:Holliday junction resolvase-like predicted endonuclease